MCNILKIAHGKFLAIMKNYEQQLLDKMHLEQSVSNNEPLKNVKEGLGSIGFIKGNPLTKTEITINYSLNFFQCVQSTQDTITQILPIALPNQLKGKFPSFLLGLTDYYGGYPALLKTIKPSEPWKAVNNLGFKQSNNLLHVDYLNNVAPVFWDVVDPIFTFPGAGKIVTDSAQLTGKLIKHNFWQISHNYKIVITADVVDDFPASPGQFILGPNDGIGVGASQIRSEALNFTYQYIPTTTDLVIYAQSNTTAEIRKIEIYEVSGFAPFTGEPALGIYGVTKNYVLSQGVEIGDLVLTYTANVIMGTQSLFLYIAEIIIHCANVAYGTFLNSFVSDLITINTLRYIVPIANINQLINPVRFVYQTLFGKTYTDSIDPRMYITSTDFQEQICDLPINLPIDKAVGIGIELNFDCPRFSMILFVEKIEALTHK